MKRVLFLPFLQIPSGHHQVADALTEILLDIDSRIHCEKVDILYYSYGRIEPIVSNIYLKWIHHCPSTYNWIYQKIVYNKKNNPNENYQLYELLFKRFIKKLILEKKPDIIVCSHALPSYMVSKLKEEKAITNLPVINVYTDYFIHNFWGIKEIDFHFVAHSGMKEYLLKKGVDHGRVFITGIPIHPKIGQSHTTSTDSSKKLRGTIMGGSLGVGEIDQLIPKLVDTKNIYYSVLCGKNDHLFRKIKNLNHPKITPFRYISNREEMNRIYERSDFVISKPGGVTIMECLIKGIPILIYHALPGQEKINLKNLMELGLVLQFDQWRNVSNLEDELESFFNESIEFKRFKQAITDFHSKLTHYPTKTILKNILQSI